MNHNEFVEQYAGAMFKEKMEYMGPIRRNDAEEAQRKIIITIRNLLESCEIN
jgi:flagellar motor switch protein FliG